jgi:hypothetical protein
VTEFLFALDGDATSHQEALVLQGLSDRFPDAKFTPSTTRNAALENAIIPLVGRPHPTVPDAMSMDFPPDDLVAEVREVFGDIIQEARAARPS